MLLFLCGKKLSNFYLNYGIKKVNLISNEYRSFIINRKLLKFFVTTSHLQFLFLNLNSNTFFSSLKIQKYRKN